MLRRLFNTVLLSLFISGLTAMPVERELEFLTRCFSPDTVLGAWLEKVYLGVAGNLVAFACKTSFEKDYEGFVAFDSKTALIKHYEQTLGATHFRGQRMFIETRAAAQLVTKYFAS